MLEQRGPTEAKVDILEKQECYRGFFRLYKYRLRHTLYDGGMSDVISREVLQRSNSAAILLYDPQRDEVVVLEQFRIGALESEGVPWLLEIVAGMLGPDETPEQVVRREAVEEAGCEVKELERICAYLVSPGNSSEVLTLFCGRVDSTDVGGIHGLKEEHEDILVRAVPYEQFREYCDSGQVNTAIPLLAAQWLAMNRPRLREIWSA